jgi:WD40 repeat protein
VKSIWIFLLLGITFFTTGCASVTNSSIPTIIPSTPVLETPTVTAAPAQDLPVLAELTVDASLPREEYGGRLAFSPDGKTLAQLYADTVLLWDLSEGKALFLPADQPGKFSNIAWSPDGKSLIYAVCVEKNSASCLKYEIDQWDKTTAQLVKQVRYDFIGPMTNLELSFSPDGRTLALLFDGTTGSGVIQLFDSATLQLIDSVKLDKEYILAATFSPDGKFLAFAANDSSYNCRLYLRDVTTRQLVASVLMPDTGLLLDLDFNSEGAILAGLFKSVNDPTQMAAIKFWDSVTLQSIGAPLIAPHAAESGGVGDYSASPLGLVNMAVSPNGMMVVAADNTGVITFWDMSTREIITSSPQMMNLNSTATVPQDMVFSPDGSILAVSTEDGAILRDVSALYGQ